MYAVTNLNSFDFEAAYNGKKYSFPRNKTVAVNDDAAIHIFGIGSDDKRDVFLRHGWYGPVGNQDADLADSILKKFKFDVADSVADGAVIEKVRSAPVERGSVSGGSLSQETAAKKE